MVLTLLQYNRPGSCAVGIFLEYSPSMRDRPKVRGGRAQMGHEMGKRTPTNYLSRFVPLSLILQSLIRCALTVAARPASGRDEVSSRPLDGTD